MIVSHKNKFIFIKTEKTAGTSLEIALSKQCGPEDVITPITPENEAKRQALGYRGPQNYKVPVRKYSFRDVLQALQTRRLLTFFNHASADYVMRYLDREVWDSYFKFCYERNPWDKAISWYYWKCKDEPSGSQATPLVHHMAALNPATRTKARQVVLGTSDGSYRSPAMGVIKSG